MRRIHLGLVLASVLLLALPASVFAIEGDRVDGRGVDNSGGKFTFTSLATGAADRANGSFRYVNANTDPNQRIGGNVTCQRISGSSAVVGGVITSDSTGGIAVGTPFLLFVSDQAKPGDGIDDFFFSLSGGPGTPPTCPFSTPFENNIRDGDIVIDRA